MKFIRIGIVLMLVFACSETLNAWGFYGHRVINKMAVFSLPPEMFGFYKKHIQYLEQHSTDADNRRYVVKEEGCRHHLDADHYESAIPIDTIPQYWDSAVSKYSADTLTEYGIVPWHTRKIYNYLVHAFKKKDVAQILRLSADLGHYVADGHVPLHATLNYNGQMTDQVGIHALWESRLTELYDKDYDHFVGEAELIEFPTTFIWVYFEESFRLKDSVLEVEKALSDSFDQSNIFVFEKRGNAQVRTYSKAYSKAYHTQLNGMVERRLRASIKDLACLWYSAWVQAGKPNLDKKAPSPTDKPQPKPQQQKMIGRQEE